MEEWLTVREVALLLGRTRQAIRGACRQGKYVSRVVKGNGGDAYEISLFSLPEKAQVTWVKMNPERAKRLKEEAREKLMPQAQIEVRKMTSHKENIGLDALSHEAFKKRLGLKARAVQKALSCPYGIGKTRWIERVADEFGVSVQTLYRDIRRFKERGLAGLTSGNKGKSSTAWDEEAIEYMVGIYLKAMREAGQVSKRRVYEVTVAEAKKKGWRVGRQSSAYFYLSKVSPLLESYAKGGRQALDNVFYIMRDYKDLAPFECIVGDQHRFDFWIKDETGRIFRPECFLWLDLRTRLVYGMAISCHYDRYLVGLAMRMGLLKYGMFRCAYTDNGKPELSNYVCNIINDVAAWGAELKDIAELYKTQGGYAVEGPNGDVIEVLSRHQWHRKARAYNAKAKPIERFFNSFERILQDLGVPGKVKELKSLSEEKAQSKKRIKDLVKKNQLLTYDEFLAKAFQAVEIYNYRRHNSLGKSPIDELWQAVKKEGFTPRYLCESEVDFVLFARTRRRVQRGRIVLNHTWYEGPPITRDNLEAGLWHLPDRTEVEVRYDPFDCQKAIAILPDGSVRMLLPVPIGSMKNKGKTNELMAWKKQMMQAVIEHYRRLTRPVPGIVEYSKRTGQAKKVAKKIDKITKGEYERIQQEIQRRVKGETQKVVPFVGQKPAIFSTEREYYKWCLNSIIAGKEISAKDERFMREYEAKMDDDERKYWEIHKSVYGLKKAM